MTGVSDPPAPRAARMSTPGAVTLGTIVSMARLGPREEKLAMTSP